MAITLTNTTAGVMLELPADLQWLDEFAWSVVQQSADRTLTGGLIVQVAEKLNGRPITLAAADRDCSWLTRAAIDTLMTWSMVPGLEMSLLLRGAPRTVIFRHHDGQAVEAAAVMPADDVLPVDWYESAVIRLMEV